MEIKLTLRGRRRSPGTVTIAAVVLLLLLTGAAVASPSTTAAASLDEANASAAATRQGSSSSSRLWRQGRRRGPATRRLLLAVGKDTNEFHVEGVRIPANGKPAGEVGFNAGKKRLPRKGASNPDHN